MHINCLILKKYCQIGVITEIYFIDENLSQREVKRVAQLIQSGMVVFE